MLPNSPLEYALWGGLVIAGWVLGYFGSTFEGKWRRRFNDERRFYAQYRDETDRLNIEKTRRISELEAQRSALSQEVMRLRSEAEVAPSPAPALVAEDSAAVHAPDPTLADSAPPSEPETADQATVEPVTTAPQSANESVIEATPQAPEPTADSAPHDNSTIEMPVATAITHPDILPQNEPPLALAADDIVPDTGLAHPDSPDASAAAIPLAASENDAGRTNATEPLEEQEPVAIDSALNGLTRIRGIDATLAAGLGSLGVRRVEDIERLSAEDEKALEIQLNLSPGQIANHQWRLQAALIGSGEDELIGA